VSSACTASLILLMVKFGQKKIGADQLNDSDRRRQIDGLLWSSGGNGSDVQRCRGWRDNEFLPSLAAPFRFVICLLYGDKLNRVVRRQGPKACDTMPRFQLGPVRWAFNFSIIIIIIINRFV